MLNQFKGFKNQSGQEARARISIKWFKCLAILVITSVVLGTLSNASEEAIGLPGGGLGGVAAQQVNCNVAGAIFVTGWGPHNFSASAVAVVVVGDNQSNRIIGSKFDDKICARDGYDVVDGHKGNDKIDGGRGQDRLNGNDGDDKLFGGDDDDRLNSGPGQNYNDGGPHVEGDGCINPTPAGGAVNCEGP